MALVTIATVAIVLGWVVVGRISWCRRGGRRIQANDTAVIHNIFIGKHEGSADETTFAAKVLQERCLFVFIGSCVIDNRMSSKRASRFSRCRVGILQWVEHRTYCFTDVIVIFDVTPLVESESECFIGTSTRTRIIEVGLDLDRVAWELAEFNTVKDSAVR